MIAGGAAAFGYVTGERWWPDDGLSLPVPGMYPVSWEARPEFALPFTCGQQWQLTTYQSHNPEDMKLDFYRVDGTTGGSSVRASAAGQVAQLVDPGGVKIAHGQGWYTLSLHMDTIVVEPGQQLARGDPIGEVGAVATSVAHLHYEQLFDADGKGNARTGDIVHPVLQGSQYELDSDADFPVLTSTNSCQEESRSAPSRS